MTCGVAGHLGGDLIEESRRAGHAAIVCRDSGACWARYNSRYGIPYPVVRMEEAG